MFFPELWFKNIDVWDLIVELRPYIGGIFGFTTVCLFVESGYKIKNWGHNVFKALKQSKRQRQLKESILQNLQGLHEEQYAILREFYFQRQNAIPLPIENNHVINLVEQHILTQTSFPTRHVSLIGKVGYFKISDHITSEISPEIVGYLQDMTEQERRELTKRRPRYAQPLEQWSQSGI